MISTKQNRSTSGKVIALGLLLSALMAASLLAAQPAHASTTFTVDSTGDYGDVAPGDGKCDIGTIMLIGERCTLRAAIQEANATSGADNINFAIPATQDPTITPTSQLPKITEAVTINGYSQPGAKSNQKAVGTDAVLKVVLSGANAPLNADGLAIGAANSTVKGLVLNLWGGTGIRIEGSAATGNRVTGNHIGTDASGTQDLGNSRGVYVVDAPHNTIGGTTAAARNVISGNEGEGVNIDGLDGNRVVGNYIGTDSTGTADLGNTYQGVNVESASDTTVGGATAWERNVISGNGRNGVFIQDAGAAGNKVVGNHVGTDATGAKALGNAYHGVYVSDGRNNTIGGTAAKERNVIFGNGHDGVQIHGDGATGNRVLSNSIFSNGDMGIDLNGDGPTANDAGDADAGPNGLQNKPVVTSAKTGALKTTVNARLNSTPNRTFTVQFFSNPSGTDEGKKFIGQKSVATDGSGNAAFSFSPAQKVGVRRTVTATATSPAGDTSEFSAARTVISP